MPIPDYDLLKPEVLARITEDHAIFVKNDTPVDFNTFVHEVFVTNTPTFDDWVYLSALAMTAADRAFASFPTETEIPITSESVPEQTKLNKAKDFLTNLFRPRGTPLVLGAAQSDGNPTGS